MILLAIVAGALTGIVLGLFGSGGSVITTPALLYLLQVEPKSAIAMSLGIVAVTATISGIENWRRGLVDTRIAVAFGLFGIVGTYAGARAGVYVPVALQLGLFSLFVYLAAYKMLKGGRSPSQAEAVPEETQHRMGAIAVHGLVVGAFTGLVGVGGGALIVPALVLLSGVPIKRAVATSLVIVAAKSYAGFVGYVPFVPINYALMGSFTAVTITGTFVGARLASRISNRSLNRGFAVFLIVMASYILLKSVI
jgi:hypothetical protein